MNEGSPDWVTLTDGERVVWAGHPSLLTEVGSVLIGAVMVVSGTAMATGLPPTAGFTDLLSLAGLVVLAAGVTFALAAYARTRTTTYVLTTEEAYVKRGLLSRTVRNVRLGRVQNTGFTQSLAGRLVDVGSVHIDTAGGDETEFVLASVRDPQRVNGLVTEQLGGT